MSGTSPNLPVGAFITTLGGRRCTALPRTDVKTQTSSSTTSTFTSVLSSASVLSSQVSQAPQVQASEAATTPPPTIVASSSASIGQFSIVASAPEPVSSSPAVTINPQPQASVADTSNAAPSTPNVVSTTAAVSATPLVANPPQSEVLQTDLSSTPVAVFTTIGLNSPSSTSSLSVDAPGSTTTLVAVSGDNNKGSTSSNKNSTVAVAGGVIGGLAIIGLIAFFIWFWRRRILRKRRSTLLTPLGPNLNFGGLGGEKGGYSSSQGGIGPNARSVKVKDSLRAQFTRVRGMGRNGSISSNYSHSSGRSVDMDRGNSQFMDTSPMINGRKGSNASAMAPGPSNDMSIKERVMGMLGRMRGERTESPPTMEDRNRNDIFAARGIGGSVKSNNNTTKTRPLTNKPDFLTLLNMDDRELDREAQRRRVSRTRDGGGGSLGGLNLDFGDPFSDANAIPRKPGAFTVSAADNPFTDANAIAPKPSTYVNDVRRSRVMSAGAASVDLTRTYDGLHDLRVVNEVSRPPSNATGLVNNKNSMYYRDSAASLESFATKRNKFRSDPFDLEPLSYMSDEDRPRIPSGRYSSTGSINIQYQGTMAGGNNGAGIPNVPKLPAAAHTRNPSDLSSRYTSGISDVTFDEWSDPGPDVGPGAQGKWEASRRSSGAGDQYSPMANSRPYNAHSRSNSRSSGKSSLKMGYAM